MCDKILYDRLENRRLWISVKKLIHMGVNMRKNIIILFAGIVLIAIILIIAFNMRTVYFVDGRTGETTKLTSFWYKQSEINIKDKWFDDFEAEVVTGIIYIEEKNAYAMMPYSHSKFTLVDSLSSLYHQIRSETIEITWIEKTDDQPLRFEVTNEQSLWVAIDRYSGVPENLTYGSGVYTIDVYNDRGETDTQLHFADWSSIGIGESFSIDVPSYVLQQFLFTEVTLVNQHETTFLLPILLIGGSNFADIGESNHYYYEFYGHDIILEATISEVE